MYLAFNLVGADGEVCAVIPALMYAILINTKKSRI